MATINFTDQSTVVPASWLNAVDALVYDVFNGATSVASARTILFPGYTMTSVLTYGATGDGTTDDTTAIQLAIDTVAAAGGGILYFPEGTYRVSTLTWKAKVSAQGDGLFSTYIKANTAATTTLVLFQNIARVSIRDMQFDGNTQCANVFKFVAELSNSCGTMDFDSLHFLGATANTILAADAGGGSANDVSHIIFKNCYLRSVGLSGAQWRNEAANGLNITFIGGIMSDPTEVTAANVDNVTGQTTLIEVFFSGSATADIRAYGGQVKVWGGRTESVGAFFHGEVTDTGGFTQAPHIIEGVQGSNSGTNFIYHRATRVLSINGNQSAGLIRCGAAGLIEKGTHTYSSASTVDLIDSGGQIRTRGTARHESILTAASPSNDIFYQMTNDSPGANDWALTAGTTVNDLAIRNLGAAYNAVYFKNANGQANIGFNGTSFGSGEGVMFVANAVTAPSTNPTAGGVIYIEAGVLKYRGSGGAVTTLAAATAGNATSYVFSSGKASGQTVYGGTAAFETLILDGTSHATPGTVYTAASNFGVGIAPTTTLHVNAAAVANAGILVQGSSSPRIRITETGSTVYAELQADGTNGYVGTGSNHPFYFRTNNTSRGNIGTSGGLTWGSATGGDKGAGTINASAYYDDGVLLAVNPARTWQNVTGSRAVDTIYQNTTGYEIEVAISVSYGATHIFRLEVENATPPTIVVGRSSGDTTNDQLTAIVPNNSYYRLVSQVAGGTLNNWSELR